jgi:hypothetical protein
VAIVPWELGPLFTSKRARREPTPWFSLCCESSVNFHIARLLSTSLQHSPHPVALHFICNQDKETFPSSDDPFWVHLTMKKFIYSSTLCTKISRGYNIMVSIHCTKLEWSNLHQNFHILSLHLGILNAPNCSE